MRSQGWAPGDYLGAKDASHSEYYGAANASHIRAVLKDDNMGLGAKRNQGDECVGLDAFQELLGRLNGKSEESLDEARKKREEAKVNKYLHRKLGTVRFVFAGYLVGDKVQALADELKREKEAVDSKDTAEGRKEKKSKKRKAEVEDGTASEEKKSKKAKKEDSDDDSKAKRREKKEKKRREKALKDDSNDSNAEAEESKADEIGEEASSRKKSKKDRKEKCNKSKDAEEADASDSLSKKKNKKRKSEKDEEASSNESSVISTPLASGTATPIPHRHLARQRFIAQKRAAVMDQAALNQVRIQLAETMPRIIADIFSIDLHDQDMSGGSPGGPVSNNLPCYGTHNFLIASAAHLQENGRRLVWHDQ